MRLATYRDIAPARGCATAPPQQGPPGSLAAKPFAKAQCSRLRSNGTRHVTRETACLRRACRRCRAVAARRPDLDAVHALYLHRRRRRGISRLRTRPACGNSVRQRLWRRQRGQRGAVQTRARHRRRAGAAQLHRRQVPGGGSRGGADLRGRLSVWDDAGGRHEGRRRRLQARSANPRDDRAAQFQGLSARRRSGGGLADRPGGHALRHHRTWRRAWRRHRVQGRCRHRRIFRAVQLPGRHRRQQPLGRAAVP